MKDKNSSQSSWPAIIGAVQSPLGYLALLVLTINAVLVILAARADPAQQGRLIAAMVVLLFILLLVVVVLAIYRPEALRGVRPQLADTNTLRDGTEIEAKIQEIASEASVSSEQIDSKLVRFIPPLHPTQFKIVRIPDELPSPYFNYQFAPMGKLIIYNIPFFLLPIVDSRGASIGHQVVDLQPGTLNEPMLWNLAETVTNAKTVHLLISAGHGWRMHEGVQFLFRRIGYVRLRFADGTEQRTDLVLGKHVREWAFGNNTNLVTEIDNSLSKPAWLSHDSTKRIDLLSIQVAGSPKTLTAIEIVAEFEEAHPDKHLKTPSIIVSAITVEKVTPS